VLCRDEVRRLIAAMPPTGAHRLIVELLYATGMRISECCQLRVCGVDFAPGQIIIRGGQGNKDRASMLPRSLEERLNAQLEFAQLRHERDVENRPGTARAKERRNNDDLHPRHVEACLGVRSPLDS
jgi:integrase